MNRTGIAAAGPLGLEMIECTALTEPSMDGDEQAIIEVRSAYQAVSRPPASLPMPVEPLPESATAHEVLLDKLGARLAFERTGVRLYETMLGKLETEGTFAGGPTREELESILADEEMHFATVKTAIETLGGDPTSVTPCANQTATESCGLVQVMSDPRVGVGESLHTLLTAELVDNDGWEGLVTMCEQLGLQEMSAELQQCLAQEEEHLTNVRAWHLAYTTVLMSEGPKTREVAPMEDEATV
jgi:bacterioferritin (cytochrome b1)